MSTWHMTCAHSSRGSIGRETKPSISMSLCVDSDTKSLGTQLETGAKVLASYFIKLPHIMPQSEIVSKCFMVFALHSRAQTIRHVVASLALHLAAAKLCAVGLVQLFQSSGHACLIANLKNEQLNLLAKRSGCIDQGARLIYFISIYKRYNIFNILQKKVLDVWHSLHNLPETCHPNASTKYSEVFQLRSLRKSLWMPTTWFVPRCNAILYPILHACAGHLHIWYLNKPVLFQLPLLCRQSAQNM